MSDPLRPFGVSGEDLLVGGIAARELAERFGTPLYVYDAGVVVDRYSGLRRALPEGADIYYAMKANPSLAVCALLAKLGAGAEAASRGELSLASAAGFSARSIVMAGPSKTAEDHRQALRMDIRCVHIESESELVRFHALATEMGLTDRDPPVRFGLRINTIAAVEEERSIIGGAGPRKFGVDEEDVGSFLDRLRSCRGLKLAGVHVFNASNVRDAGRLIENAARIFDLAASISEELEEPLDYVDVGGGLGIPYAAGEEPLDVEALGRGLTRLLDSARSGPLAGARLVLEPGRYLVGESGVYLSRVLEVKTSRGKSFALVDGGIHHLLRPVLLQAPHPIVLANRVGRMPEEVYDVAGPLCTGLDVLGKGIALPEVSPGNVLAVLCAGAYGYSESMLEFLSHPSPAEVIVRDGEAGVARPRGEPEEGIARQSIPAFVR